MEMTKDHLANVQNQIRILREQKQKLDTDIENLVTYFQEGVKELEKSEQTIADTLSARRPDMVI
jgi:hypothetical protein